MVKIPVRTGGGDSTPPDEFASVPPDIRPTTGDLRLIMMEIGKLTTKVDRLITDVEKHDTKLEALNTKAAMIQGGLFVLGVLGAFLGWLIPNLVNSKVVEAVTAVLAAHK